MFDYSLEEVDRSTESVVKTYANNISKLLEYNLNKSINITLVDPNNKNQYGNLHHEERNVVVNSIFSPYFEYLYEDYK